MKLESYGLCLESIDDHRAIGRIPNSQIGQKKEQAASASMYEEEKRGHPGLREPGRNLNNLTKILSSGSKSVAASAGLNNSVLMVPKEEIRFAAAGNHHHHRLNEPIVANDTDDDTTLNSRHMRQPFNQLSMNGNSQIMAANNSMVIIPKDRVTLTDNYRISQANPDNEYPRFANNSSSPCPPVKVLIKPG